MVLAATSIISLQASAMANGDEIYNERTGEYTKTLFNTLLSYPNEFTENANFNFFTMPEGRAIFPYVAASELAWALSGQKNVEFISKYSKMWSKFTNEQNEVDAAYGYRMRRHFGRDQLLDALDSLIKNKSSRQILVNYWDPATDGLLNEGKIKNVPCPFAFQLNVGRNDSLYLTVFMRSSDLVVGLPYDYMFYDLLAVAIANELKLNKKGITILSANSHIYTSHEEVILTQLSLEDYCIMAKHYQSNMTLTEIITNPEEYVEHIRSTCIIDVEQRKEVYNPKPEVYE